MNSFTRIRKAIQYARDKKFDSHSSYYRPVIRAYLAALEELSPTPKPVVKSKVKSRIITNKIKCIKCGDILESKTRHDFKMCSCNSVFVDGGVDYMRRGGSLEHMEDLSEVEFFNE